MKIHVFVEKYPEQDPAVIGAWDEYSVDANEEGYELELEKLRADAKADQGEVRILEVEIPDGALDKVFQPPSVKGKVVS